MNTNKTVPLMRHNILLLLLPLLYAICGKSAVVPARPDLSDDATVPSGKAVYETADSLEVVRLLNTDPGTNDVLFYARHFIGRPYVAHTLEVSDPERLVVNLRRLDCTTLVETVLALARTRREGGRTFARYLRNLEKIRYRGGQMNGYLSRLHYFSQWWHDNVDKELIVSVELPKHFTAPLFIRNHYMSRHPERYRILAAHPEWTDSIARMEHASNGADGYYLPESRTGMSRHILPCINDGDLVAIVTTKDGLDYSHLGFAVWGTDDKLHLLNASSVHKKVVEETKPLRQYLAGIKSSIGIRIWRLK